MLTRLIPRRLNNIQTNNIFVLYLSTSATTTEQQPPRRQPGPPPIRVALTESAGRGVFATRRIAAGELVHTAQPTLTHPSLNAVNQVCYFCLRKIKNLTSFEGQSVGFCSDECKLKSKVFYDVETRADWSDHDEYCRAQGLKYPLLVKRFACMIISGAASADTLDILQPASLSHDMIYKMEEGFDLLRNTLMKANIKEENMAFLTHQWYTSTLARIRINAFRIELAGGLYEDLFSAAAATIEAESAVGNAVYILPSLYNHDCDPNLHIVWIENTDAKIKALRDVEPDEELRICYIDASMDRDARQNFLAQGFGFQCNCLRCSSGD